MLGFLPWEKILPPFVLGPLLCLLALLAALSMGEIVPYTDDQVRFISVAWQLQPARTPAERAWVRLVHLVSIATSKE